MKIVASLAATVLAAIAVPAHAQWYAGGTVGASKASIGSGTRDEQLFDLGFDNPRTSVDDKGTAFRVYGGYRFHRNFAAEVGYVDLGRFELRSAVSPAGTFDSRMQIRGADLSVLGLLPVGERWTLFGRAGVLAARNRSSFSSSGSVRLLGNVGEESERSTGALFGVGAMAAITPNLDVRLEYTEHRKLGDDLTGDFSARVASVGLQYRF